jgi:hypothetical protein
MYSYQQWRNTHIYNSYPLTKLKTAQNRTKDGQFLTIEYAIPEEISKGRTKITVRFQAHEGNMAGSVFGVRTIRK